MPTKDYYLVLGVSRTDSPGRIRSAFRDLVRRYHPDRVGPCGRRYFQAAIEAYAVLSDSSRRASYDRGLQHADAAERDEAAGPAEEPATPIALAGSPQPAPLVPDRVSILRDFHVTRPSYDEVFERFLANFIEGPWRGARRLDALRLEVAISREQATYGGVLVLGVPVFYPCRTCRGAGWVGTHPCGPCSGSGMVEEEEPVRLRIPPMVRDGSVFHLPLRGLGIQNLYLVVRVRVTEA